MKDYVQNLRYRKGKKEDSDSLLVDYKSKELRNEKDCLPNYIGYLVLLLFVLSLRFFLGLNNHLPSQVTLQDEHFQPERFIGQRAESFLKRLTDIGTRVVGSYENEVLAVDLLQREISFIVQQSETIHKIETDVQKPTGSYYLALKPHNFRNYYANIQNIVVKFSSEKSSSDSILLNCHYDTVPESPGASDNGLNCAVLLEILNKLSKLKKPLHNTVIFLFNGAEENPLQASHGFITQHKWSKDVKAVINLDSGGAGGKEVLFQTTSTFPWLVKTYAKAALYPTGGVHAEELFQSGIIPSDTDFRIFRDFGKVPGLDFAHIQNGYVYHTKFDTMDFIAPGVIQHTGDNILALVKALSSSPELGKLYKPETNVEWKVVYFDVFGLFMVVYSELFAIFLNLGSSLLSLYTIYRTVSLLSDSSKPTKNIAFAAGIQFMSWLLSAAVLVVIAKELDISNFTMSWYNKRWLIIPLYFGVLILTNSVLQLLCLKNQRGVKAENFSILLINGSQFIWTIILIGGTIFRIRSSFIFMLIVLSSSIASAITTFSKPFSAKKYITANIIFTMFPILFILNQTVRLFTTLIPMTARMGPQAQPEMVIAGLVIMMGLLSTSYLVPLILILKKPKEIIIALFVLHIVAMAAVTQTSFGFPYSGDVSSPALQRFYVLHSERTFHDSKGNVRKMDSGFFVQSLDRNNIKYVSKVVPELQKARSASPECVSELNCGAPIYTSRFINTVPFGYWVEAYSPLIHHPTNLVVVAQTPLDVRTKRISFVLTGPDHITIVMSPRIGVRMIGWTFDNKEPQIAAKWMNRDTYMVYYSHGLMGGTLEFDLDFEVNQDMTVSDSILDIAVIGHYMHDKQHRTEEFKKFLSQFPDWAHVTAWTTTYKSWVI